MKQSIDSAKHLSPRVSALLSAVADYPNVPRKQKKFEVLFDNLFTYVCMFVCLELCL